MELEYNGKYDHFEREHIEDYSNHLKALFNYLIKNNQTKIIDKSGKKYYKLENPIIIEIDNFFVESLKISYIPKDYKNMTPESLKYNTELWNDNFIRLNIENKIDALKNYLRENKILTEELFENNFLIPELTKNVEKSINHILEQERKIKNYDKAKNDFFEALNKNIDKTEMEIHFGLSKYVNNLPIYKRFIENIDFEDIVDIYFDTQEIKGKNKDIGEFYLVPSRKLEELKNGKVLYLPNNYLKYL